MDIGSSSIWAILRQLSPWLAAVAPRRAGIRAWGAEGRSLRFGRPYASTDALADDFPLHLGRCGEQVQEETRHGAFRAGVDRFCRAEEPD